MKHRTVLLFPGQASQQVGMGRLAFDRSPQAREVFERVDAALDEPISRLCFEGPAERLQETRWQQPAVFACSLAIYAAWCADGDAGEAEIVGAAGHSLGEYSALVAAGAVTLEDAARLVALRGRLMQEAADREPGGMAAIIGLDHATVAELCRAASHPDQGFAELVVLANDNAPEQQVVSGGLPALERVIAAAKARGAKRVQPLKVAGAFHSPLMAQAEERLAVAVAETPFTFCAFPIVANSSVEPLQAPEAVRAELVRQLTAPVRWVESVYVLSTLAPESWVDTGPGTVMAGLATRIVPGAPVVRLSTLIDTAVTAPGGMVG